MALLACLLPVLLLLNSASASIYTNMPLYPCNTTTSILQSLLASGKGLVGAPLTHTSLSGTLSGRTPWTASGNAAVQISNPPYPCNTTTSIQPLLLAGGSGLVGTSISNLDTTWTPPGTGSGLVGTSISTSSSTLSFTTWTPSATSLPSLQPFPTDGFSGPLGPKYSSELEILTSILGAAQHRPTGQPSNLVPWDDASSPGALHGFEPKLEGKEHDAQLNRPRAPGAHANPAPVTPLTAQLPDDEPEVFEHSSQREGESLEALSGEAHLAAIPLLHGINRRSAQNPEDLPEIFGPDSELGGAALESLLDSPHPSPTAILHGIDGRSAQSMEESPENIGPGSEMGGEALESLLDTPHPSRSASPANYSPRGISPPDNPSWDPGHGSESGFQGFVTSPDLARPTATATRSRVPGLAHLSRRSSEDCDSITMRTITSTEVLTATVTRSKQTSSKQLTAFPAKVAATWIDQGRYRPITAGEIDFIKADFFPSTTTTSTERPTIVIVHTTINVCPHSARDAPVPTITDYVALSACLSGDACQPFLAHTRACFETLNPWTDPYDETKSALFLTCVCQTTASEPFNSNSPFFASYGEAASCLSQAGVSKSLLANESNSITEFCRSPNPSAYFFIEHLQSWLSQLHQGTTLSFDPLQGAITAFVPSPQWTTTPPLANLAYGASAPGGGSLAGVTPSLTTRMTTELVGMAPDVTKVATVTELVTWLPIASTTSGSFDAADANVGALSSASGNPVACDEHIVCVSAAQPRFYPGIFHFVVAAAVILDMLFGVGDGATLALIMACSSGLIIVSEVWARHLASRVSSDQQY